MVMRRMYRWMQGIRASEGDGDRVAFALRLAVSFAMALLLVGVAGYVFMNRQLQASQIEQFAAAQRTDAKTFALFAEGSGSHAQTIARIDRVLQAARRQRGTLETLLIDQHNIVRASGKRRLVGSRDSDPRIEAALRAGRSYAGHEAAVGHNPADFEFVVPVNLPAGRYAYEISYDHDVLNADLASVRRGLLLVGLLALLGGGGVFYLFGGRALLRSHRLALQRATRDGLTDLPNQRAFQDEFPQVLAAAVRNQDPLALIALDVDDFKFINDRHGHSHGDEVLKRVAAVLVEGRPGDRAYRVGGDEFALLLPHTDPDGVRVLAKRLLRNLNDAQLHATIGLSAAQPGKATELMRAQADAALYEAKDRGGNQIAHFDDIRDEVAVVGAHERAAVRRLIDEGTLTTVYQPIWNLSTGALLGVEALSRPDPAYGFAGPAEAFDIAEQMGFVHELDVLCVKNALTCAQKMPEGVLLFFNLCPRTLDLDADGNDWLRDVVQRAGFPLDRVVIEITERFGGRASPIVKCLQRLRSQGFKIAIDDVGTGNSGLAMLRQVTVDFVKLDRSIVAAAPTDASARGVLMAVATFARQTGAFVIAEGIEDNETLEFLQGLDDRTPLGHSIIQGGQGYGVGRPTDNLLDIAPTPLGLAA
jgi:diguanylate cyclase (GGDEF)-like protein